MSNNTAVARPEEKTENYRLPRTVIPLRYEIKLTPDLKTFKYDGEEVIHVEVKQPVKEILLNAIDLEIRSCELTANSGTKYSGEFSLEEETERLKIKFPESIPAGKCNLKIVFTGVLNDKLRGFYRSRYKDDKGNEKWIASTQLEAVDARRAFPCFDEPDFKAVFQSTLIVDEHLTALSNTSVKSEKKLSNGKKEVAFADTIKMSSYLVAYVVGEFEGTNPVMADGKPIRIWAPVGRKHLAKFAEGIAKHSLTFFAKYYGVPYAGDKLDLIAIPDFAMGAMENLGCVTFRETALLVDEKTASHAELERVADVVAHEIAHMWFGDLTTMSWWNGIWLNEAFATFAELLAVHKWKPDWKRWETFGVSRAGAMAVDGLHSTRTIEFPVRWPQECEGMFDVLTYQKGCSVLRQLEQYLTEPVFQKGISIYLQRHQFANTETKDLWAALEEASKQPVVQIMDSWIFHSGYPLVKVELAKNGTAAQFSQQRFFYDSAAGEKEQLFQVPMLVRAKVGKNLVDKKILLTEKSMTVDFGGPIEWVVVNEGGHGFYRVHYSSELAQALTAGIFNIMSGIERFNFVNDTWASVVAGHTPLAQYLKMLMLFLDENDKNVWSIICGSLSYLDRMIAGNRANFEHFVRRLVTPAQQRLGWEAKRGEDELTGQLRGLLIGTLGVLGDCSKTQQKAKELYAKYKTDKSAVDPNILSAVVGIVAVTGDQQQYKQFVEEFKNAATPQDEERYRAALTRFKSKQLLGETLKMSLNGDIRAQDAPFVVASVMLNNDGRELAWNFVKENWDTMLSKYANSAIPRMLEGITALVDPALEKDVLGFFKAHEIKAGAKTVEQHIERLHVAVQFKQREQKTLNDGW
jgi:puromycin-sensitive aminopeptidase